MLHPRVASGGAACIYFRTIQRVCIDVTHCAIQYSLTGFLGDIHLLT